jgi:hypothetical protein
MYGWILDIERTANNPNNGIEDLLHIFFENTAATETIGNSAASTFSAPSVGQRKPISRTARKSRAPVRR